MEQTEKQKNNKLKEEIAENLRTTTEKIDKSIAELIEGMAKKNAENILLKEQNAKLLEEHRAMKRKMARIEYYLPEAKKFLISRALPAELINELFVSLPLENAFDILAKMTNSLLALNVRRIFNSINMAMKANKWNNEDCGPNMLISKDGLAVEHSGPDGWDFVRTELPIPMLNLNPKKQPIAYFKVEIIKSNPLRSWLDCIQIGFCTKQFPLQSKWLGNDKNSIGIYSKRQMRIDGSLHYFENGGGHFQAGDVIGLGIVHFPTMKCFATYNGELLGMVKLPANFTTLQLFPAVKLIRNGKIRADFGREKWRFNLEQIHQVHGK